MQNKQDPISLPTRISSWLDKPVERVSAFLVGASFVLLSTGYSMIYPEPQVHVGLILWALWLVLFLVQMWRAKIFRRDFIALKVVITILAVLGFSWFGWTKLNARPAVAYPWISAAYAYTISGQKSPLTVLVKDYSSDPYSNVMSLASLHNLSVSISVPISLERHKAGFSYSSCPIVALRGVSEWSNQDRFHQPIALVNLRSGETLFLISMSARDAAWQGFLAVQKKDSDIEWEAQLSGWAQLNGISYPMSVREVYRNGKMLREYGTDPFQITADFLEGRGVKTNTGTASDGRCAELSQ